MNYLRKLIAVWVCKAAILMSKLLGKKGSSMPGDLALMIYPKILKELAAQVRGEIIAVCGTNGKTTTNNLLYSMLKASGKKVVCNNLGANMLAGITCAFVSHANLIGKLDADCAAIEIDEASCVRVFPFMKPDVIIITNLFRDQLDRYGEIDIAIRLLAEAFLLVPKAKLILNGDDPLVARFGKDRDALYVGVDCDVGIALNETKEGRFCTFCGKELEYEFYHYSQLGKYNCNNCGFRRPDLDFRVHNVALADGLLFDLDYLGNTKQFNVNYRGFYNIYNIVLSFAGAHLAGADNKVIDTVLDQYKPQIGRMETFVIEGKPVILNLSKNPAGFNQGISTVLQDGRKKDVMIVINDGAQDGKDISWLWDVDFERLNHSGINSYIVSGIRCNDMAVRLKYGGFLMDQVSVKDSVEQGIKEILKGGGEVIYILVNYTSLFSTQDILKKMQ